MKNGQNRQRLGAACQAHSKPLFNDLAMPHIEANDHSQPREQRRPNLRHGQLLRDLEDQPEVADDDLERQEPAEKERWESATH